jgi:hypothetical protein
MFPHNGNQTTYPFDSNLLDIHLDVNREMTYMDYFFHIVHQENDLDKHMYKFYSMMIMYSNHVFDKDY